MNANASLLQDRFLTALHKEQVQISMFLVNGIKLVGHIHAFDQYVILLGGPTTQKVYKHAISTILPSRDIAWADEAGMPGE